ncbi:MAG: single-stranded-DNA-specific exonuclease RecJ [Candidatus Margulisiibacteriota bacterium]|jgi:single-stranded-DNA-specific exonuclease
MSNLRWQIYPQNEELCQALAIKINKHPIIAQILLNRNLNSLALVKKFLDPEVKNQHNFSSDLLIQISDLINIHQKEQKKILLYGDYDVDGITSTALMLDFLKLTNPNVHYYIPHRLNEGYGLNLKYVKSIVKKYDLIITLDNGISGVEEIKYIKANSDTKVIIMDHHTPGDVLPEADLILNPKLLQENHPLYYLAAVGVVYKFLEFYIEHFKIDYQLTKNLDLVALGTIADIAPLVQENRTLTKAGLHVLNQNTRFGIKILLEETKFKKTHISPRDVSFSIAPLLNASGRLTKADISLELLLAKDEQAAKSLATKIKATNSKRQELGALILKEAESLIKEKNLADNKVLVISNVGWHSGLIGITAAQLTRKYHRPVVMIGINGNMIRGSARSYGSINIYKLLARFSSLFLDFGGHKEAAGFSLTEENLDAFIDGLTKDSANAISDKDLLQVLDIDCQISPKSINLDLIKEIHSLAPFGSKNPMPVFYSNELLPIDFKTVGNGDHLKVTFVDQENQNLVFDGIGFGLADKLELLYKKDINFAFQLEISDWMNNIKPQITLVDIK